eukprot:g15946.t1
MRLVALSLFGLTVAIAGLCPASGQETGCEDLMAGDACSSLTSPTTCEGDDEAQLTLAVCCAAADVADAQEGVSAADAALVAAQADLSTKQDELAAAEQTLTDKEQELDDLCSDDPPLPPVWTPTVGQTWNYHLNAADMLPEEVMPEVDVYVIDMDGGHVEATIETLRTAGKYVVCYISIGTFENWRTDWGLDDDDPTNDFPAEAIGEPLSDWEGERYLDSTFIKEDENEPAVYEIMRGRVAKAKALGCHGIEPDNMAVGYLENTGVNVDRAASRLYADWFRDLVQTEGMRVGMKNLVWDDDAELPDLAAKFDFGVNEQCSQYDECNLPREWFIDAGKPVFHVEYREVTGGRGMRRLCSEKDGGDYKDFSTIVKTYPLWGPYCVCGQGDIWRTCGKNLDGEEQTTSRTMAATPARNDHDGGSPPPPDYNWGKVQPQQLHQPQQQQQQQQQEKEQHSEVLISDGESSIRSVPERVVEEPPPEESNSRATRRVDWRGFDKPSSSGGRDLATRKCAFKIFVVFRGAWCMSSYALLKGFVELNRTIKRAGGKVVALSSQTPEQVGRMVHDLSLPFQAFGDPGNDLVYEMNRRFKMGCTVSRNAMVTDAYPNGMAQPCVLAVYSDEAQDEGSVLFKWNQWQTIASMRHADAWAQTVKALTAKKQRSLLAEAGTNGGGGGTDTPRSSMPCRPKARDAAPSPFTSGRAPFADQMVDAVSGVPPPSFPRATAATVAAAAAAAEVRSPRGHRARTIEEAVDSALAVGWNSDRNPAAPTLRGAATGGIMATPRARPPTPSTARGYRVTSTPRGAAAAGQTSQGGVFFPKRMAAGVGDGSIADVDVGRGAAESRARDKRWTTNSGPQLEERGGEQPLEKSDWSRRYPVTAGPKHQRPRAPPRPGGRAPSSAPAPALPPQHRRPTQAAAVAGVEGDGEARRPRRSVSSVDDSGGGDTTAPRPAQQKKGAGMSGSSRRFWFGSNSNSRRSSFAEAATDFADGGRGGGAARGGSFASTPGGSGAAAGGLSIEVESAVPPSPGARRWGYLRKGVRPPTPKAIAR